MKSLQGSVLVALYILRGARAVPQVASGSANTDVPTLTISTVVASPTVSLNDLLPPQEPLAPKQAWCPSEIFCAGPLLQTVNLAQPYTDPKTFVDKPTAKSSQQVLSDFQSLNGSNVTEGDIVNFVDNDFKGEGLELEAIQLQEFKTNPAFLNNVTDPILKAWSQTVHGYWTQLIRSTNETTLCHGGDGNNTCESTLIPLNHTFVVPGGRFREQYYWDSYWILRGLLKSELFSTANDTLQNFMDELDRFGFIPNGGRIYYLNRSQPPLFIQMLDAYVKESNDTSILKRALPLAEKELAWWKTNRTLTITSPYTNQSHDVLHYAVNNTAPRPESFLEDYLTVHDPTAANLTAEEQGEVYSQLATGAESGWDFTARFAANPTASGNALLRSYNVKNQVAVDLNSILYRNHKILANFYTQQKNSSSAGTHSKAADALKAAVLDLLWDPEKLAFYDFNLTSNARNDFYSSATFYPVWSGIIPDELTNSTEAAFGYFSAVNLVLNKFNGTFPVTFVSSGQQWDAPNAWPPHQFIILEALQALPSNITNSPLPTPAANQSTYNLVPAGQLNIAESDLPSQLIIGSGNATKTGPVSDINKLNGTVFNGGNATDGEGWSSALQRQLANRYFASALCSWRATGGSIPGVIPRLSDQELNVTQSVNNTGNMFEKFSMSDIDSAGRGGEYTVQAGFGWTNGVVLWIASTYGDVLVAPNCPDVLAEAQSQSTSSQTSGASGRDGLSASGIVVGVMSVLAMIL
ncbi:glycoside hydrolase [Irpex rosettiformis]|uniref:Glycoside hydrolase n=1 Tax=Irpex rosettiformis TaxID=378272 RepID=A0ACB8U350_9APHY|nr:glycoside hydrolase [Irpex rosettiformis]